MDAAWPIVVDVVVATGSLWAASLLADVMAHLAAHGSAPRGAEVAALLGLGALVVLLKTFAH